MLLVLPVSLVPAFLVQLLVYGCGICGSARHDLNRTSWDNKGIEPGQPDLPPGRWRLWLLPLHLVLVRRCPLLLPLRLLLAFSCKSADVRQPPFGPLQLWEQCGQGVSVELPAAPEASGFDCALSPSVIAAPEATGAVACSVSLSMRFAAATSMALQAPIIAPPSSFCRATIFDTAS